MANEKNEKAPGLDIQLEALAGAIAAGITQAANQTGPVKQIPITKYRTKTPWNPKGLKPAARPQFARAYWQNGHPVELWHVTDEDVRNLNLLKAGRYIDRKVEVVVRLAENGQAPACEIRYSNATADQRFELKNLFRNFSELLRLIVEEQEAVPA